MERGMVEGGKKKREQRLFRIKGLVRKKLKQEAPKRPEIQDKSQGAARQPMEGPGWFWDIPVLCAAPSQAMNK